jgi:hydrogenase-4 component B
MSLLGAGLGTVFLAGILARALERQADLADRLFRWGMIAGCLLGTVSAVLLLATDVPADRLPAAYGLDPLSAWFVLIILGVGANIAVYGTAYLGHERPGRRVGSPHLLLAVLLVALVGVVTARTVVAFLAAWEVMAIAAWLLVIFERDRAEVRQAGLVYLVLTHLSTIALFGMFAAWGGGAGSGSFGELAAAAAERRVPVALVLGLGLVGFGIKAGVVPGHIWLPGAHAAAPSHISALLSGVMLKIGIYGLLRILSLVGTPPPWWGWTVLILGLVSAVLGVLWALAQHDLKRLLAYHSVENIGIILLGLGVGALGVSYHHPGLALLGFTGALLHTLNHSLFKSLLFLGAGAVVHAAGTREIDRLGGMVRVVPRTAWAFLIGSIAIVGLPPLNGFVSEWVVFRALLDTGGTGGALRAASVMTAGLALTGALALACFSKVHGVLFLGSPRSEITSERGAENGLVAPQLVLAGFCVAIGLLPFLVIPAAARVGLGIMPESAPLGQVAALTRSASMVSLVALALLALVLIVWRLRAASVASSRIRTGGTTWGCAFPGVTNRMQHTASSYAASLLGAFGPLSGAHRVEGPMTLRVHAVDPVFDSIGRPVWTWLRGAAVGLRRFQSGRIFWYLLYVITALLGLLVYLWRAAP